jgi:hypothetical protein
MKKPILDPNSAYLASQNQSMLVGYLLVCLMMVSLAVGIAQLGSRFQPGWTGGYLVAVALVASLEAFYTRKQVKNLEGRERIFFRISEWIAFAVAIKMLLYIIRGPAQLLEDLPLWQEDFLEYFFTGEYMIALIVTAVIWFASGSYAGELEELFERERDASWDEIGKLQNAFHDIRRRIASRIFIIGTVVVILAILSRVDASAFFRERGLPPPGYYSPVVNVLVYFILALILLSLTQFALMRTRWMFQRLPISPSIAKNWIKYGFIFFMLLAVVVFFLPTEYSLGLLETLGYGMSYLIQAVTFLIALLMLPFSFCISLFSLFAGNQEISPQQPAPMPPPTMAAPPDQPVAWLEFLRSLLFWAIFVGIIFFAFRYYFLQNKAMWTVLSGFPLVRWLSRAFGSIWSWLRGANKQIGSFVRSGIKRFSQQRVLAAPKIFRRVFNLSRMSPRDKVIYFYLNLVQLGEERGLDRKPSETPYQYENDLSGAIPEVQEELHGLTDTFLEARYSRHSLDEPNAQEASSLWERIKAALRKWRKNDD